MKTIKIKKGNKYPRILDLLWFITKWFNYKPYIYVEFILPELDNSNIDLLDSQDWKKVVGINLQPSKPSNYRSIQIGFRANHATGKWDLVAYYNSPNFPENHKFSETLVSLYPNEKGYAIFKPNNNIYRLGLKNSESNDYNYHEHDFGYIGNLIRLSSTHYGGKDDNNDGIGNGYSGPSKFFKLKIKLTCSSHEIEE